MLYDVPTKLLGQNSEELSNLKNKIKAEVSSYVGKNFDPLNRYEIERFVELRNQLTSVLMKDTLSLRDVNISEFNYSSHGLRPELEYASVESDFRQRLVSFLTRYTFADNIKALTSFSLPREDSQLI